MLRPDPAQEGPGLEPGPSLDCAARLLVGGVNPIPILPSSKRPAVAWKDFQDAPLIERSADELDRWLCSWWDGTDYGVGAITGAVSGIVVVDIDDDDAADLVHGVGGHDTVTAKTSKGSHLWFAHPGGHRPNRTRIGGVGLDVRADGGYVVCPPSLHPSGFEYTWETSPWEFEANGMWPPAPMPPALIELIWPEPARNEAVETTERPRTIVPRVGGRRYAAAALEREAEAVRSAPVGGRNHQLTRSSFAVARFIPDALGAREAADVLLAAAAAAGLAPREAEQTILSGFKGRGAA